MSVEKSREQSAAAADEEEDEEEDDDDDDEDVSKYQLESDDDVSREFHVSPYLSQPRLLQIDVVFLIR